LNALREPQTGFVFTAEEGKPWNAGQFVKARFYHAVKAPERGHVRFSRFAPFVRFPTVRERAHLSFEDLTP